jgi:UDP-glucuronate decarboxylase
LRPVRHVVIQQDMETIASAPLTWERLFGKTILITGANGFVSMYMLETLLYLNEIHDAKIRVFALQSNF